MTQTKITLEDLQQKLGDPNVDRTDLAKYFRENPDASSPFAPAIEINPDTVVIPDTSDAKSRSAVVLNAANWIERSNRHARFRHILSDGSYKGPVIVEEGDSWFQFPVLLDDTIDVLLKSYAVYSLSAGGDTLKNMLRRAEYRKALKDTGGTILLLSAGGNDLVANGNLAKHLREFDPTLSARDYLLPSFDKLLGVALGQYNHIFKDVSRRFPEVDVICHGYDYALPDKGKWLGKPMATRKIKDKPLQEQIARVMMDRFNSNLARVVSRHPKVHYLDLRGTVRKNGWHDELHPKNPGYAAVAKAFKKKIETLSGRSRGRARSASTGPKAMSLHVGLNVVDQGHYLNSLVDLDFCVADADAMEQIAKDRKFKPTKLIDDKATRKAVQDAVKEAAKKLGKGDIFLFSYAGHGGQVPDFDGDELQGPDGDTLDETLCLYDGQLIDDELHRLWAEFAEGVRIVAVFDCCHSGSVVRAGRLTAAEAPVAGTGKVRAMSLASSVRVFNGNRAYYRNITDALAVDSPTAVLEADFPVRASLIQLSACQSNQVATESFGNGLFTEKLLTVLGGNNDWAGYRDFLDGVASRMPTSQSPNYWTIGAPAPLFEAEEPFSV